MTNFFSLMGCRPATCGRVARAGLAGLLTLLLPWAARAQAPIVTVTPAGPLILCPGATQTLTATATATGFNLQGSGFDGTVNAVVVQSDGKVLVGGDFTAYNGNAAAPDGVLRLNADGSLDTGFNGGGAGTTSVLALAVQPYGKVLVGGTFTTYNGDAAVPDRLVRLNADGSLDNTFNSTGTGLNGGVYALAVKADGQVIVGGAFDAYNGSPAPSGVLGLAPNGTLNSFFNFGTNGSGASGTVYALAVQPDGKVLIGGGFTTYGGNAAAPDDVLRLNADGTRDNTFNPGGAGANGTVQALAVLPNGQALIGGTFTAYNGDAAYPDRVLRLNANGTVDNTFNFAGFGANGPVNALAAQPDGKVLVGGDFTSYNGAAAPDHVLRLDAGGLLDAGFNAGGTGANSSVKALALQADGKVLVGGGLTAYNGNAAAPDYLLRLQTDGTLDSGTLAGLAFTWSNGATGPSITVSQPGNYQATAVTATGTGYSNTVSVTAATPVTVQLTPAGPLALPAGGSATLTASASVTGFNAADTGFDGTVNAVAVQPDGKVLVAGDFTSYNGNAAAPNGILRLNANGTLDNTFNPGQFGASASVSAVVLQPDGKVLIGGYFTDYNGAGAPRYVLRLNANGTVDNTFSPGGTGLDQGVSALVLQPDGKVLIGGYFVSFNGNAAAPDRMLRLNANGTLDTGFNNGASAGFNNIVTALVVQPDGKVLVGGPFTAYNGSAAAPDYVLRLNTDGTLDNTFNPGGTGPDQRVVGLAVQPDGKILAGGFFGSYNGSAAPDRVLRLNANGTLDNTFNPGGSGVDDVVAVLTVQPDGKILVGGRFTAYNGSAAAPNNVLRLNADGTLDTGFNSGGSGANDIVYALAVQPDGKVLIGGVLSAYNGNAAVPDRLVRLNADGSINIPATLLPGATFVFNPGTTTGTTRTVNTAGTYTATYTDPASGCTYTSNAVVVTTAVGGTTVVTNVACFGGSTGAINLTPSGGTGPYTYVWDTGATTEDRTGLTAGTYSVTITDVNGAQGVVSNISVTQPPALAATTSQTDVTTNGGTNGSATITVSGGTPGYTYAWSPNVSTTATASNLSAGTYNVTATDANGCTIARSFTISQPATATVVSITRLTPSPTATAQVSYLVTFGAAVTGVTASNFGLTTTGIAGAIVAGVSGSGTTYTVTVNTGTGNGTLRLDVVNSTGLLPTATNIPYTTGEVYALTKSFGTSPLLTIQGAGGAGADVTAFVDVVQVLQGGSAFANGLQNGSFETHGPLGNGNYGYNPTAAGWTFVNGAGIAENGSAFGAATAPNGIAVAFLQNAGSSMAQNLSLPTGTYQVSFQTSQRNCCSTGDQVVNAFINGVFVGSIQPLSTAAYTLFTTASFSVVTPLPVELVRFTVEPRGANALLRWATASEKNNDRFEVEASADGRTFQRIGQVAGQGNSAQPREYQLTDLNIARYAASPVYYRLRQVDADGTATYSPVRSVAVTGRQELALFPNPTTGAATLLGAQPGTAVAVFDAVGRQVLTATASAAGTAALVLPRGLATGVYVVRVGSKALRLTVE